MAVKNTTIAYHLLGHPDGLKLNRHGHYVGNVPDFRILQGMLLMLGYNRFIWKHIGKSQLLPSNDSDSKDSLAFMLRRGLADIAANKVAQSFERDKYFYFSFPLTFSNMMIYTGHQLRLDYIDGFSGFLGRPFDLQLWLMAIAILFSFGIVSVFKKSTHIAIMRGSRFKSFASYSEFHLTIFLQVMLVVYSANLAATVLRRNRDANVFRSLDELTALVRSGRWVLVTGTVEDFRFASLNESTAPAAVTFRKAIYEPGRLLQIKGSDPETVNFLLSHTQGLPQYFIISDDRSSTMKHVCHLRQHDLLRSIFPPTGTGFVTAPSRKDLRKALNHLIMSGHLAAEEHYVNIHRRAATLKRCPEKTRNTLDAIAMGEKEIRFEHLRAAVCLYLATLLMAVLILATETFVCKLKAKQRMQVQVRE